MNKLERYYDRLSAVERFKLSLAALSRGAEVEARTLAETCPTGSYRLKDPAFARRIEASTQVVMVLALELVPRLAIVRLLDGQADYVGGCLELMESCGFDSAIDAHWRALDPDRGADRDKLPMPDMEALAAGAAGVSLQVTGRLRDFWSKARARELATMAAVLECFGRFSQSEWAMTGTEALREHAALFHDLDQYQDELAQIRADDETAERVESQFRDLWRSLIGDNQ